MKLTRGSRVLVSALDWGLGHASRASALVSTLRGRGCTMTLAGSGRSLALLRADHPDLPALRLASFSPRLSRGRRQWVKIGLQVPTFLWRILTEHWRTRRIVDSVAPDLIVSDNRYGVWDRRCRNVLVCHQLRPQVGEGCPAWVEGLVSAVLRRLMQKFDAVLVPDIRIGGLSGSLSAAGAQGLRAHSIGLLSRLPMATAEKEPPIEWLGIVSGPEPRRSQFEAELARRLSRETGRRVIVCGRQPGRRDETVDANGIEMVGHATASRLRGLIESARHIVCQSGYSTIMDLTALGRQAELIPTPGQAEQEYLARRLGDADRWTRLMDAHGRPKRQK